MKRELLSFWQRHTFSTDPEKAMFARLFRRLLLWYFCLLAVIVVLSGVSIGSTVPWLVVVSSEHDLSGKMSQLAQNWQTRPDAICPLTHPGKGYMFACYNPQGEVVKSSGIYGNVEKHFLDNALALRALGEETSVGDALNETGTEQVQFDLVFLSSTRPGMVREALRVRAAGNGPILGVVQLGTTPTETLARRAGFVNIFFIAMFLAIVLGVPAGSWYLAGKALLPTRLAFQRQRDFIANVSHELGTPLALLRANADILLLNKAHLPAEEVALIEDIVVETTYMDKTIDNMLLLARMDTGRLHLQPETFDLARVAETTVARMQILAEKAPITLIFQQEESAPVRADRTLLEQVMLILLDNALKYTPAGGKVSVYTYKQQEHACLRIHDTGIGIAATDLERLGERFYRVDKARSRETGGNGLGISIARGILAVHDGELTLTSEPGKGTTAIILLPLACD